MRISVILLVVQITLLAVVRSDDVLGTRPFVRAVLDKLPHPVHIRPSHILWHRQIHGDHLWDAELIQLQDRVWRDDSTS